MNNHRLKYCRYFLLLLFLANINFSYSQKQSDKLKKREQELKKQIEQTKELISKSKQSQSATITELKIINQQIKFRQELISTLNAQVKQINKEIKENEDEIKLLETKLIRLKEEYAKILELAYKNRNFDHSLMYVFASESVNEAYRKIKYLQQYTEHRKNQVAEIKKTQQELLEKIEYGKEQKLEVEEAQKHQVEEKKEFDNAKEKQKIILSKLKANEASLKTKLKNQEEKKRKIEAAIREAIKKEVDKGPKNKGFKESPESQLASKNFVGNKGRLPWPVEKGTITGNYGRQQHSVVSSTYIENNGIDISTNQGANIRAVFKGKVTSIITIPGAGKAVLLSHGSYRTVYANLEEVFVEVGQEVITKQDLGKLLKSNNESISVAHFEIWKISLSGMETQNPALWIYRK